MADAYATVANGGVHYDPECIISIEDKNGNVIVDNTDPTGERVFSREVARAALEMCIRDRGGSQHPWTDDRGITYVGVIPFLLDPAILG